MRKIYIADPNEEFRLALAELLSADFYIEGCGDGMAALERIRLWEPDIVVSELLLEKMDGIALLRELEKLPQKPKLMVITGLDSQFALNALRLVHIQYAMLKPCRTETAVQRIREIVHTSAHSADPVTEILMEIGLPNGRDGFAYLQTALPLLMLHRDRRLSKELYEEVAAIHNSTPARVEKAIRDTLHHGWEQGSRDAWLRYFPGAVRTPRNKDFLFRITDILNTRTKQNKHLDITA